MLRIIRTIRTVFTDKRGVTALEYSILAAMAVLAVTATSAQIRTNVAGIFGMVSADLAAANTR